MNKPIAEIAQSLGMSEQDFVQSTVLRARAESIVILVVAWLGMWCALFFLRKRAQYRVQGQELTDEQSTKLIVLFIGFAIGLGTLFIGGSHVLTTFTNPNYFVVERVLEFSKH